MDYFNKPGSLKDSGLIEYRITLYFNNIIDQYFGPKVTIVFNKCLMNGMVLVCFLISFVIKKHHFRNLPAIVYHISFFSTGRNPYLQLTNCFYLPQCFNAFY